jgi:hypothetical protein
MTFLIDSQMKGMWLFLSSLPKVHSTFIQEVGIHPSPFIGLLLAIRLANAMLCLVFFILED